MQEMKQRKNRTIVWLAVLFGALTLCLTGVAVLTTKAKTGRTDPARAEETTLAAFSNRMPERAVVAEAAEASPASVTSGVVQFTPTRESNAAGEAETPVSAGVPVSIDSNAQAIVAVNPVSQVTNTSEEKSNIVFFVEFYQGDGTNTWIEERVSNRNVRATGNAVVGGNRDVIYRRIGDGTN